MRAAAGAGLIDLGEDRSEPAVDRYRRPARHVLPVLAAVLVALVLAVTGRSERVRPGLIPLAEVPASRSAIIALSADMAFVGDWADTVVGGRQLLGVVSAYPLPGAAARWQAWLPVPALSLRVAPAAGVVLAMTAVEEAQTVIALDAGTGRELWRADSREPVHVPAEGVAGLFYGSGASVHWVDLRTGRDVWSRSLPPDGNFGVVPGAGPTDRTRLLTVSPDGAIDVVDETTGALVTSGRIRSPDAGSDPGPAPNGDNGTAGVGGVLGRILAMQRQTTGSLSVTAFAPETLRPLWTVTGTFQGLATACGNLVCMPDAGGLNALDPASGATAWRNDEWDAAQPLDPWRLLAFSDNLARGLAVLDAATGQVLARLTGWTSIDDPGARLPVLLARPDDTGGNIVARLDPGRTRPTVLGDLRDAAASTCQASTGVLVCATVRHSLRMWRYGR